MKLILELVGFGNMDIGFCVLEIGFVLVITG
jgi:hypothetical protein